MSSDQPNQNLGQPQHDHTKIPLDLSIAGQQADDADATPCGKRRIGVYVCHCGGNISDYVDVEAVRAAAGDDAEVVVSKCTMFACADGTQHEMIDDIKREGLDGLVVASCSPKLHQATFRSVANRAGLNQFAYTQVNVREQDSWAHTDDHAGATKKAIGLVQSGINRTKLSDALESYVVKTTPATLVIGGGITGLRTALGLANVGLQVYLIEKEADLGGWVAKLGPSYPTGISGSDQIETLITNIKANPAITVFTSAALSKKEGSLGNYDLQIDVGGETITVHVGSIVVATGFSPYVPDEDEFGYGTTSVVTLPQFTSMLASNAPLEVAGKPIKTVAYIYCVGSRQEAPGNEYCSKYCCSAAINASIMVSERNSKIAQYHLHRDVRAYGKNELAYEKARAKGAVFMKVPDDQPPTVEALKKGIAVHAVDVTTASMEVEIPADLVVLVTGMTPRDNDQLTDVLKLPVGPDGFYNEIHPKLRPVETVVDGVMIAGCCQGPKTAGESVTSGLAAVAQSAALLKRGIAELDPLVAIVHQDKCTGCTDCFTTCPYAAIETTECDGITKAIVNPATCKGCGGCVPICPTGAIDLLGYTDAQMRAAITGIAKPHAEVHA